MTGRTALRRALAVVVASLLLGVGVTSVIPTSAATADSGCTASRAAGSGDSYTVTEPLVRTFGDGTPTDSRCFQLTVDRHTNLQDHERINVTWSGAHVTGGRSLNPYGASGMTQEYPVVLMECRGVDAKAGPVPAGETAVSPSTCWTGTYFQRSSDASSGTGIWQQDADNSASDTGHISGIDPAAIPSSCTISTSSDYHITPFVAASGTTFPGCSAQSMPPEATANSVSIPNEAEAFTNGAGDGTFPFEVRTDLDNESLGCSATVPCTLEVIPIDGINCASGNTDPSCNSTGRLPAGAINPGTAPADAVSPTFWWSGSNWNRRVAIPLGFAPPPSVCQVSSAASPVPFYGTELLSQAALQWTPAYCLNKKRFYWQDNIMPDDAAFTLMTGGSAAAAEVTRAGSDSTGVGYAPTAVTGWGIGFDIDQQNNAGQQMSINLNARLLAKLLTESYPGSIPVQTDHPGFSSNPLSLNTDPEFIALNPGLDTDHWSEAASALMSLSTSSGIIEQLTSYIASDPSATAFIQGQPDPWGMKVNPFYKNIKLPVSTWPLLDTWVNSTTGNSCLSAAQTAYMPLVASPVSSLRLIATALLYNWPYVGTGCTGTGSTTDPFQLGRVAPEGLGSRFILGLVTLADARRYGLTVANLEAAPGHYVAADDAGMAAAVKLAKRPVLPKKSGLSAKDAAMQPLVVDEAAVRKSPTAYPGTIIVYTAAKTRGLPKATAKSVAQFIEVSSTEGQVRGRANGQLPEGYLPITRKGVTASLYAAARTVGAAVAKQAPAKPPAAPSGGGSTPTAPPPAVSVPTGTVPAVAPPPVAAPPPASTPTVSAPVLRTAAVTSSLGGNLLPTLLFACLIGLVVGVAGRLWLVAKGLS